MSYDSHDKEWIDSGYVSRMFPRRDRNAHKGNFGHVLVVAGKRGMAGAAVLSAGAALRSGCGLVTVHVPEGERSVIHIAHPSAIVSPDSADCFSELPEDMTKYTAVGAGPGLGTSVKTVAALGRLMDAGLPMVLDADALNIISMHPEYAGRIPRGSVLTPHIGELRRLLKSGWTDEGQRNEMVRALAESTGAVVVVKGANTMICPPSGHLKFNTTGNPGMAKGGSGDVLAGLVAGLLARGFDAEDAAIAGVFLHGAAGDRAAELFGEESMNASDILDNIRISLSGCSL